MIYALQADQYNTLPNAGGLRDQPHKLLNEMRASFNVYRAFKSYINSGLDVKWVQRNPDMWKLIGVVWDMRKAKEE